MLIYISIWLLSNFFTCNTKFCQHATLQFSISTCIWFCSFVFCFSALCRIFFTHTKTIPFKADPGPVPPPPTSSPDFFVNFYRITRIYFNCSKILFILYSHYKNRGYVWKGIKTTPRPKESYRASRFWNSWIRRWPVSVKGWHFEQRGSIACHTTVPNLLRHCNHAFVDNLPGPVTLTPVAEFWQWSSHSPFQRLWSVAAEIFNFPHVRRTLWPTASPSRHVYMKNYYLDISNNFEYAVFNLS